MNIKTKFLEDYVDFMEIMQGMHVNFADKTKKKTHILKY